MNQVKLIPEGSQVLSIAHGRFQTTGPRHINVETLTGTRTHLGQIKHGTAVKHWKPSSYCDPFVLKAMMQPVLVWNTVVQVWHIETLESKSFLWAYSVSQQ